MWFVVHVRLACGCGLLYMLGQEVGVVCCTCKASMWVWFVVHVRSGSGCGLLYMQG